MEQESARKILAASFSTSDGGSRGAGALGGALRDKIGNTAVLYVRPDGKAKFVESKDWGAGRGALLGGAIGILGGPLGIIAGGSIGALVSKLRDSGFKNDQLEQLGRSLGRTVRRSWSRSPATRSTRRRDCSSHSGDRTSSSKISTRASRRSSRRTQSLRSSPSRPRPQRVFQQPRCTGSSASASTSALSRRPARRASQPSPVPGSSLGGWGLLCGTASSGTQTAVRRVLLRRRSNAESDRSPSLGLGSRRGPSDGVGPRDRGRSMRGCLFLRACNYSHSVVRSAEIPACGA